MSHYKHPVRASCICKRAKMMLVAQLLEMCDGICKRAVRRAEVSKRGGIRIFLEDLWWSIRQALGLLKVILLRRGCRWCHTFTTVASGSAVKHSPVLCRCSARLTAPIMDAAAHVAVANKPQKLMRRVPEGARSC